ncbi:MAG TPA: hypothetical protein VHG91_00255 [Longimicrobium sp.]|nr:hypothetical protein [Longimicrobium sp.]
MTRSLPAALALAGLLACGGGGGEGKSDPADVPGVDASGTSDTELFTENPGSGDGSVPVAGQGGTVADSTQLGQPGTGTTDSTVVSPPPATTQP